jgi:ABC-2 type transport system permease protein
MGTPAAPAYGPSALGGDVRRFVELTLTLARTEFKLRYFGSVLGYVWSLMRPLLFFGVLYVVFTKIFKFGSGVPHYGVYLLTGIVLWTYLAEATAGCVQALVAREALVRKVRFPRMVIPLSVSLTALFNLGMNFIAVLVFALANGVSPTFRWLELIPIIGCFVVLATGLGMLLSALYVRYRDVQPIWEVALQAWFYCSPVMYVASGYESRLGSGVEKLALINPAATLLTQMGHAFIAPHDARLPSAATAAHGFVTPVAALAIIIGIFALGWWYFTREAPRVAENL